MSNFASFANILPDPANYVSDSGSAVSGDRGASYGPGFASVKFTSDAPTMVGKTNSGRLISRRVAGQTWKISIKYNPMTRDQFEPIYNFLLFHGRLNPFYVRLPQYQKSRHNVGTNSFDYQLDNGRTISVDGAHASGSNYILTDGYATSATTDVNSPRPGEMFTITDSSDTLHTKAYRIVRVEDNQNYLSGSNQPTVDERRLWIHPTLARATANNSTVNLASPQIRVIMSGDVVEYNLKTDNLYTFGLNLVEAHA